MQRTSGRRRMAWLAAAVVSVGLLGSPGAAAVRLPRVVGSHMVLQRDAELPIWGWADPGEQVTVAIAGHEAKATADAKGRWTVKLPPMKVGGPHTMVVQGKTTVKLTDILVGEVWVGSGQSNMQWSLARAANARKEIAAATYPKIRLFNVPRVPAGEPADDVNATWQACMPGTAKGFSAVLYLFGRELHKELGVPVGLINTSWGGTRIEPWTPPCGFAAVPKLQPFVQRIAQANARHKKSVGAALDHIEAWLATARKAQAADERTPPMPTLPRHPLHSHGQPTGLYNGMVAPLVPFAIRGAIWYQGESNCLSRDGMAYYEKKKALIGGWRKVWAQGDFPFYFVQLAPFRYRLGPAELPKLWEAQTASLAIPNTGMIVTTDIATVNNIHPPNKQAVGRRLALWALANDYGRQGLVYSGPLYKSMKVEGGAIRLSFDHLGGGLAARDGKPLSHFQIAGADKKFVPAQAKIDGDTLVVASPQVAKPLAVRFGWDQLAEPNLMNQAGLPASPFRTDRW